MKAFRVLVLTAFIALVAPHRRPAGLRPQRRLGLRADRQAGLPGDDQQRRGFGTTPGGLGSLRNDYAWGHALFNGSAFFGTARDVGCYLTNSDEADCPDPTVTPGVEQRAEIWRYTPVANQPWQGAGRACSSRPPTRW